MEDKEKNSYPHYQADFTLNGAMYHVRFDGEEEFKKGVEMMKKLIQDQDPIETSIQGKTYNDAQNDFVVCEYCGKPATRKSGISKTGKPWRGIFCTEIKEHVTWGK